MNYTKPEIVLSGTALGSIQGVDGKGANQFADAVSPHPITAGTPGAYEADE